MLYVHKISISTTDKCIKIKCAESNNHCPFRISLQTAEELRKQLQLVIQEN